MAFIRLCLLAALSLATLSLQAKNPINDFCRRWGHQTAEVDGKLFIDGGLVAWNPLSTNPSNYTNTWLLYSDLNSTTQDVGMPPQYANLTKNATVPSVAGGILWADEVNKCFYLFGGQYQSNPTDFSFWSYDVPMNQWNETKYTSNVNSLQRVAYGAGTTVEELGLGFYYGGWMNNLTNPLWSGSPIVSSNLIRYDFTRGTLNNNTGPDSVGRAEGQMVYLPASDGGLLVYFGGVEDPYRNGTVVAANMSTIRIFDISSSKWYAQTASGDVPKSRRQFCAGATWADDHSSYNIYLYGGFGVENVTGYDDSYILSLPSFKWIKSWPTDNTTQAYPHGGCTANVINRDQMIVMGGWYTTSDICDSPNSQGQHNMNLGYNGPAKSLWDKYDPKVSKYFVPTPVISAIGGGPTGGATAKTPTNWDNADLGTYFTRVPTFSARAATRVVPTGTSIPSETGSPKKTNVGAIVGGVVGGLVGLILILSLVLFCLHRRKKTLKEKNEVNNAPPPSELAATSLPQELPSPGLAKYMSLQQQPDPSTHPAYSGRISLHSRFPSDDYRYMTSPYPAQQNSNTSPTITPPYPSPYNPEFPREAHQQRNGYVPYSDNPNAYDTQNPPSTPAAALERQYSYPSSIPPAHPPFAPAQQPQVYYPPPPEPSTHSRTRQSFSDHIGSPDGTQRSMSPDNEPPSTAPTPAQFYAQPVPRHGALAAGGGSPSSGSLRGSVDSRRRMGRGRFVEVDYM
ncbi:hypothetical protein CC80DRAFT_87779 [Byssothecium circinans]|uniref:Galactose oxidase n=1 Tax=Byssothecium circinans TaxID=147558 RepID=A0A6A5TVC8_9PLEO|nr:hypothetical protein CC80DRAFT_87779 [Byssothecium circinans]